MSATVSSSPTRPRPHSHSRSREARCEDESKRSRLGSGALAALGVLLASVALTACVTEDGEGSEVEVISQIELSFESAGGGAPAVFLFDDPDGAGGSSGTAETVTLAVGTEYYLHVRFINALEDPAEEITEEIEEEAEEHQVFIFGDGVVGPASSSGSFLVSHEYADVESDYTENAAGEDLPVGLSNDVLAENAGSSELRVMLRHLPPLNGDVQKVAGLADSLAAGEVLPGEADVDVTFPLTVQ